MKDFRPVIVLLLLSALLGGCSNTPWRSGTTVTLAALSAPAAESAAGPPAQGEPGSPPSARPLIATIPPDWAWLRRGSDLVVTRDGVYLQSLTIERFHITQKKSSNFMFPRLSFTALSWPLRTVLYLQNPLTPGMNRDQLIDALLASHRATPGLSALAERGRRSTTLAGDPAGRVDYDFRLEVKGRQTPYRGVSVIALVGEWCEVVTGVVEADYDFNRTSTVLEGMIDGLHTAVIDTTGGGP